MTVQEFETLDVLRLEVADEPSGLVNLVQNPNGELGGWGWLTPIADTTVTGDGDDLRFTTSVTQAAHFTTEPLPIEAGRWAAARLDGTARSASTVTIKARYRWLDAGLNEISLTTQTAAHNLGVLNVAPAQAPVGTEYVELRIDVYVSGGNPTAGTWYEFREVTVAEAATSGELATIRINLAPNPSFESPLNTQGWAGSAATIGTTSTAASPGSQALVVTRTATGTLGDLATAISDTGTRGIPVVGGKPYTLQAKARAVSTARVVAMGLTFYNAAGESILGGSVVEVGAAVGTGSYVIRNRTITAPASAVTASIELGTAQGAAGEQMRFDHVMLEQTDQLLDYFDGSFTDAGGVTYDTLTAAPRVTKVRTNLATNPSLEPAGTAGWTVSLHNGSPLASGDSDRSTAQAKVGAASLRFLNDPGASGVVALNHYGIPVQVGKQYAAALSVRGSASRQVRAYLAWATSSSAGGSPTSSVYGAQAADSTSAWQDRTVVGTAPGGTTHVKAGAQFTGTGSSEQSFVDGLIVEEGSAPGAYFDGATADSTSGWLAWDRAWTGTAHASTSTETETITLPYHQSFASNLPFIEPTEYLNILGSSHSVKIVREELNVGTLEATIADAALDPAQTTIIRPGRRTRMLVLSGSEWRPLFTGRILNGKATYDPLAADENKRAAITLTAVDDLSVLAQHRRAGGVEHIAELPFVLEGCGVPWNVNGSGDQVPTATVVAINENASAVDQVAVTRDNELGRAWLDTRGVLQAWEPGLLDTTVQATLDETTYSDVAIDYDTDRCINVVTVVFLRSTGAGTEEIPYGPYEDSASVAEFGPHSAEFRVQWADEDETAIEAYADAILTANATPVRRINSVRLPIRTLDDLSAVAGEKRALLDLVDLVTATNTATGLSTDVRVAKLEHQITARDGIQWTVGVEFYADGSVAPPQVIPSPPVASSWWPEMKMLYGAPSLCPSNWLVMDGSTFSASEYPLLAAHLVTLGFASGVLPDFTDRFVVGAGTKAIGTASGGAASVALSNANIPNPLELLATGSASGGSTENSGISVAQGGTSGRFNHPVQTHGGGASTPLDILNPWRAAYFIIRAR